MAVKLIKVEGYSIETVRTNYSLVFVVYRHVADRTFPAQEFSYFSDAAQYVAKQKGIDGDFHTGFVQCLIQIYSEGRETI